jgi:glycosyltransferase involved in cell wall biosynthesis
MLLEALCSQGHTVDLLTYHEGSDIDIKGLRILRTSAVPGVREIPIGISWKKLVCDLLLCGKLLWLSLTRRYDVIHAVEEAIFPAVLLRRWFVRARIVYDMDSAIGDQLIAKWRLLRPIERGIAALERAAIRRVDAVFAVCKELATRVSIDAPRVPVFVIEDVALPSQAALVPTEPLRDSLGIRGAILMYVGNLHSSQGVEQLISAMALLPSDRDATLVVIGGSPKDIARMRTHSRQLSVEAKVILLGPRALAHLGSYLMHADVLVSPRLRGDNTPMKIYAYMKSGRPILATRVSAHTQVLDDQCACLVDSNPHALARGLTLLLDDADLRARLGAAARMRAEERYSLDAFRERVRAAYECLEPAGVRREAAEGRREAAEVRR